jgi:uncharacterized protein YukE
MTEPLQVTPTDVRITADQIASVSTQMKTIQSTLQSNLASLGAPWGDDEAGNNFANGSGGYLAQLASVNADITNKTQVLDQFNEQLNDAADSLQQQDES